MAGMNAGEIAYLLGLAIAVLAGIAGALGALGTMGGWASLLLVVLGIVVGLMNISDKEATGFLIAAIALVVAGSGGVFTSLNSVVSPLGTLLNAVVVNFALFAAPAAIITAVKAVHAMASKK